MMYLKALRTEFLKLRRTRITWVLGLVYAIAPLMMGLMMVVLKNPELGTVLTHAPPCPRGSRLPPAATWLRPGLPSSCFWLATSLPTRAGRRGCPGPSFS